MVKRLEAAGSNAEAAKEFAKLSKDEQQAVIKALTVTKTEVHAGRIVPIARPSSVSPMAASGGCWNAQYKVDAYSNVNIFLYTFNVWISWCGDGTNVTAVTGHKVTGSVHAILYFYDGIKSESDIGGVGYNYYAHYAQGQFEFCAGGILGIGCVFQGNPWVQVNGYGNATATGTGSPS